MKLSPEQIDRLYEFTRQHYVEYYDLQTELVDHLANAIEEQWQENPKLSFETALDIEFRKFGVFGFMDVVEKRQIALNKKYNQIVVNQLKTFFTIPKIIGTFSAIVVMFYILKLLQGIEYLIPIIIIGMMILFFVGLNILARKAKRHFKKIGKKWILNEIILGYSSVSANSFLIIQVAGHFTEINNNQWLLWFWSIFTVLLALTIYIILILVPSKAQEYLKQTYPEYEFVS